MNGTVDKMLKAVEKAQNNSLSFEEIYAQESGSGKNQFLMFIKPEIMLKSSGLKTKEMFELVLQKIEEFGLKIHDIKALGAKYSG